ncbi:LmbU family transcriptional regulator [Streptomyces sp. NPDC014894]|uniref:LmbU family transcriptional regulator n=1 Tax=unclassified Streptomyces TaxID=2593676 RepID=UPI0036FEDEA1
MITRVGLQIPRDMTYQGWERAGQQLSKILDSSAWCLGDWLVYGKDKYADRYLQAIELANLDYQTLRNYAWVARRFDLPRRHELLSFQHHAEVASLAADDQDRWLDLAERQGWSRNRLRQQIRQRRLGAEGAPAADAILPRLHVPSERIERWKAAADHNRTEFECWIVAALDRAAARTLESGDPAAPSAQQPDAEGAERNPS